MEKKSFYEDLGIETSATESQIKKAYHKLALKNHPDKNQNDPDAAERFKVISKAYEILSDPEKKSYYDKYGMTEEETAYQDPIIILKRELGVENLTSIIGEVSFFEMISQMLTEMQQNESSQSQFGIDINKYTELQEKHVLFVYETLKKKTMLYTDGGYSKEDFKKYIEEETKNICKDQKEFSILESIGKIYLLRANIFLEKSLIGFPMYLYHSTKENIQSLNLKIGAISSIVKLMRHIKKNKEVGEMRPEDIEILKTKGMKTIKSLFSYETNTVLKKACDKLLLAPNLNPKLRNRRAIALKIIGKCYQKQRSFDKIL